MQKPPLHKAQPGFAARMMPFARPIRGEVCKGGHFGLDSLCPSRRATLKAQRNTGYERTTIGNQLRPVNPASPGDSTSAPGDPCAVVVYADATGRGSRVGLGAGT